MGIGQKVRSLHCGFQQGLGFEVIAEDNVILLKNVPFELENVIAKWIAVLPEYSHLNSHSSAFQSNHLFAYQSSHLRALLLHHFDQ